MKLATVFSGIGAVEHALETIGIKYELIFACDNGDINPFDLKIKKDYLSLMRSYMLIQEKVSTLNTHEFEDNHGISINEQLNIITNKLKLIREKLEILSEELEANKQIQTVISEMEIVNLVHFQRLHCDE